MADVNITNTDRFTNTVEFTGNSMSSVGDWLQVHAHSSEYSFAANVTSSGNFTLALEANFNGNGNWFTIDTSKTINEAGPIGPAFLVSRIWDGCLQMDGLRS